MNQISSAAFKIIYHNKDGVAVTNYGTKREVEDIADYLENQKILFKVEVNSSEREYINAGPLLDEE